MSSLDEKGGHYEAPDPDKLVLDLSPALGVDLGAGQGEAEEPLEDGEGEDEMDGVPEEEDEEPEILMADRIFLIMKKEYRLSRNTRALWYFSHMDAEIVVHNRQNLDQFTGDLEVVSVMPQEPAPAEWDWDTGHLYKYRVSSGTMVTFLSRQYRFVYMLDFSPSAVVSDIKKNCILLDQQIKALRRSLEGVIRPFTVPGSQVLFTPDIYVTVIAWSPFLCPGAQAVLHQGCLVTPENLETFMDVVVKGLHDLEDSVSRIASFVINELETIRLQSERIVGDLFEETEEGSPLVPSVPMAAPDTGFVNMIQTAMLALQLLPDNSSASILVITDGVLSVPDINILDTLLNQLRSKSICLSFLEVSSSYHPHAGFGYCPYNELMSFMSLATSGTFLSAVPEIFIEPSEPYQYEMNQYHEAFLAWSFRKVLEGVELAPPIVQTERDLWRKGRYTEIRNTYFLAAAEEGLVCKKRLEMMVNTNLTSILSCRLREGYTVNTVRVFEKEMKVKLTLPWKHHTFIHYTVFSAWPAVTPRCRVEVSIEGPYDIVYDIICQTNKQFSSHYRTSVIKKFYLTLQQLNQTDKLLVHINSFCSNPSNYTLPDTIRNGLPLFTLAPGTGSPVLYTQDTLPSFVNFWRPIFSLDINIWHRWMHTHRISLLLQHDQPLPKHLLIPSPTGRYHPVLCKKAASKVSELIEKSSEFCLLENHSYISFIRSSTGHPTSFYVIKVTSKPPCLVVWLAFLGGIPGSDRHQIVSELSSSLESITMKQRVTWRDLPPFKIKVAETDGEVEELELDSHIQSSSRFPDVYSCMLLSKPVEKILVRYENVPSDYCSLLGPIHGRSSSPVTGQRDVLMERSRNASAAFLTLSRYLIHQRWIFSLQNCPSGAMSPTAVSRILNTICKTRLQQGFSFAHSSKGVQNMVLEVPMLPEETGNRGDRTTANQSCVIQYIIFPPHTTTTTGSCDGVSEDDFGPGSSNKDDVSTEADGEVQIILEVWTEPQDGRVSPDYPLSHLAGKKCTEISGTIFPGDLECISTLVTFEHLIMMCQNAFIPSPLTGDTFSIIHESKTDERSCPETPLPSARTSIQQVPFAFNLLSLLPKAHQTEMIFSLFIQDLTAGVPDTAYSLYSALKPMSDRPNEMLFEAFTKELTDATDRELNLSTNDCQKLPELIMKRQTSGFHFQQTYANTSGRHSFHSSSLSSHHHKNDSSSQRFPSGSSANKNDSRSRRFPSGASATSSTADTFRDIPSQAECSTSEYYPSPLKWRCFLKAISPTHLVFTVVPATYEDLKTLTQGPETLDGQHPDIIDIIKKVLPSENTDLVANLDDISINSSIPNLEVVGTEGLEPKSPRIEHLQTLSRQRSGSDMFEMNRPKVPTPRKSSGEPAVMRDRTVSLDGLSQFRAKAHLRKRLKEARERDRTDSFDTNTRHQSGENRKTRYNGNNSKEDPPVEPLVQSPSPIISSRRVVGSMSVPIYIYDCNILGLTNTLIYNTEKAQNHHLNFLFKPELKESTEVVEDRSQKTPEPGPQLSSDPNEQATQYIDKDVKHWYQVIKMIYFKSFVSVLFRCLQLKLPIHTYDLQHAMDYCDNDTATDLDLESFVKAVCPHVQLCPGTGVLQAESIRAATACSNLEGCHKSIQKKFSEIVGSKFKVVPEMEDIFFFCPPGLDFGESMRISSRRRDETKSSDATSKRLNSNKDDEDDKTIEFRSTASQHSYKFARHGESVIDTDIETAQRDVPSSLSSGSNFQQDWDSDEEDLDNSDEFSPPLFIQFSFAISQRKEDIISVPLGYLPSCLAQILQDKDIPDPEQDLSLADLGLRMDIVCMTLPREVRNITDIVGGLRSTSLCSTLSCRDSRSADDDLDLDHLTGVQLGSSSEVLSHLPTYQHKAVLDIREELNWMLMDEIAFALSRTSSLSYQTLDFISKHVQASTRERPGSKMEAVDLDFVFGSDKSFDKFREHFAKINVQGYLLKQEAEYYYLDLPTMAPTEEVNSSGKRKSMRLSRHLQLSPVKESLNLPFAETKDDSLDTSDCSDKSDPLNLELELKTFSERVSGSGDWKLVIRVEQERVLMFIHYREHSESAISTWKNIQLELRTSIREICTKVNQELLLADLHDTRHCNRLLEPETNEDAWGRQDSLDFEDTDQDTPYLEANMNMQWAPGRFQCPEVWRTTFCLHPRLKQGQGHSNQSWGMQAIKNVLMHDIVSNRSDMFVYMDDNKNIFYIKICEQLHSSYSHNILSRQTSVISKEEEAFSRTSSIGSSKQLRKMSSELKDFDHSPVMSSRSNSVGESDKARVEDQIIFKVFGIEEVGRNIKEDLTAVLQKKLDFKVVEVISMMLKRNSRCKLACEDVVFLQKPGSQPTSTLQFRVHVNALPYLLCIVYYLKQNLVQIPTLLHPNYTAGNTRRFKDNVEDQLSPTPTTESDIFLYNDHNEKGGRDGIGVLALSLVDGKGNLVKQCSHPKPTSGSVSLHPDLSLLEETIQTELYVEEDEGARSPGPGPLALIQFRVWESGRIDMAKLSCLLESAIKHSMWDAVLEFKLLPAPLCVWSDQLEDEEELAQELPTAESTPRSQNPEKLSLKKLSQEAISAFGGDIPDIVVDGRETDDEAVEVVPLVASNPYESGDKGLISPVYQDTIWSWLKVGAELEVPSYQTHTVRLQSKHEMGVLLAEVSSLITNTVTDLEVKLFIVPGTKDLRSSTGAAGDMGMRPSTGAHSAGADKFLMIGRNIGLWKQIVQEEHDLGYLKKSFSKHLQNFPSLIQLVAGSDSQACLSPPHPTLVQVTPHPLGDPGTPLTPLTPGGAACSPNLGHTGFLALHAHTELFVPRQTLVLIKVSQTELTFHMYNLSRDCVDKLVNRSSEIGEWLTARSSLLRSVVAQKLGLFNNQSFTRKELKPLSRFVGDGSHVENLLKYSAPPSTSVMATKSSHDINDFLKVYKSAKINFRKTSGVDSGSSETPPTPGRKSSGKPLDIKAIGKQILDIWNSDSKQCRQSLYLLWDSRGENCNPLTEELIRYMKQKARLLHYVFTPLLFLPQWRQKANETRDQGLPSHTEDCARHGSGGGSVPNGRHHSDGSIPKEKTNRSKSINSQEQTSSPPPAASAKSPSMSPRVSRVSPDEKYHADLIANYFQEYEQYLQTLGFTILNIASARRTARASIPENTDRLNKRRVRHQTATRAKAKVVYLQKSLRGGLLIFEIGISEPFFYTKLHALEAQRLHPTSNHSTSRTFTTTFLEDCDNIKILIHLHSFTYDYHLRTISGYISQKTSQLRKGFHVVSFLEDFMKYYSKGPNFARNFVQTGSLHIISQGVSPLVLYNYLLSHEKQYGMHVIRMEPVYMDPNTEFDNEFILVQVSTHRVPYRDHQDAKRVDEFDVSLIISYDACPAELDNQKNVLSLKYFVLMTSKRDLLPMLEVEKKQGNFRAVVSSMVSKNLSESSSHPPLGLNIPRAPTPPLIQALLPPENEEMELSGAERSLDDDTEDTGGSIIKAQLLSKLSGIRRESVNYVGYYSAHEETMKTVIQSQSKMAEERITLVVRDAMVDCRRDQLWQRLVTNNPSSLSFKEFVHLTTLVHSETLDELDPRLGPLLNKNTVWYYNLSKLVSTKYAANCRQFASADGQIQHTAILTPGSLGSFALVSVDFSTKEGSLAIVYREPQHTTHCSSVTINSKQVKDFVELCCFHLWTQLL